jgi:hypothetical protein
LIYPIVTIFLIWAISGHVGPAEAALGLLRDVPGWSRALTAAVSAGFASFGIWRGLRAPGWKSLVLISFVLAGAFTIVAFAFAVTGSINVAAVAAGAFAVAAVVAGAFAFAGAGPSAGVVAVAFAGVGTIFIAITIDTAVRVTTSVGDHAGNLAYALGVTYAAALIFGLFFIVTGAFAGAVASAVAVGNNNAIAHRWHGIFLALFLAAMFLLCLAGADLLSPWNFWKSAHSGPLLLFLGLLTLLNAPFDWASLGLTRALLRRGLEREGWWPYGYAFVDAALAGVIIALLAVVMVIGVQAFDELAMHGGGENAAVLPLPALFDGIAKNPAAPEYWWAYALFLSSMILSLVNLAISGMALTRGIPWLARLLLQWIPEGKAVPEYKRQPAAIGLTIQMFAGAFLGIAAQALLAWGLIFHVMPWIGLDLLDMARAVAAFDLPARVAQFFAGSL